jgi:uncharacterized protein YbjQ (UPF0145 family)
MNPVVQCMNDNFGKRVKASRFSKFFSMYLTTGVVIVQRGGALMDKHLITTGLQLEGYRIVQQLGIVRGITVRSRSILGNIGAGLQSLLGGNITIFTELCEKAREEAFELMVEHAEDLSANAIIGMRYDANDVADGITEVLCYGTAVRVEKV